MDNGKVVSEESKDIVIPSFGQIQVTVILKSPGSAGTYTVIASLERENVTIVTSVREIPFI
jgi:hypothetical protein